MKKKKQVESGVYLNKKCPIVLDATRKATEVMLDAQIDQVALWGNMFTDRVQGKYELIQIIVIATMAATNVFITTCDKNSRAGGRLKRDVIKACIALFEDVLNRMDEEE